MLAIYNQRRNRNVSTNKKGVCLMVNQKMSLETMEYVVWVIEIAAREFFGGDKTAAYDTLKNSGLWGLYTEHYETTHTLGSEYILDEMREYFTENGVKLPC
jgi:hypothetical protein